MTRKEYHKLEDAVQNLINSWKKFPSPEDKEKIEITLGTFRDIRVLGYLDVIDILRKNFDPMKNKE